MLLFSALFSLLLDCAEAAQAVTSSNRFLFIVDVAAGHKTKSEEALRQSLFDLIYSGVRGYMTNGDSYGVWLAGGANDTSGTVEVWRDKYAFELAARAALRVKDRGLKGKPCLREAMADAARVAKNVGDVTVVVISDGETPLSGTGFDSDINARLSAVAAPIRQVKGTANTVLAARDGSFVAWAVNSPEFLITMPDLPAPVPKAKPAPEKEVVSTPSPAAPEPQPAPVRIASKPIIITRDTVDRERQVTRAMATTTEGSSKTALVSNVPAATIEEGPRVLQATNPTLSAAASNSGSASAAATNSPFRLAPAAPSVAVLPAESSEQATNTPFTLGHAATPTAAEELPAPMRSGGQPMPARMEQPPTVIYPFAPLAYAAAGAFFVCCVAGVLWFLRRPRAQESLISRALAMERTQGRL